MHRFTYNSYRMKFSFIALMFVVVTGYSQSNLNIHPDLVSYLDTELAPFYHGVASGDPTENSVILWTKVTLDTSIQTAKIHWELASDEAFKHVLQKGKLTTTEVDDFTIKPDVTGLQPNTTYYYRFRYKKTYSITGITKTLPSDDSGIDIAFASCSNFEWGYFNNYRFIAEDPSIDLVVHLGDYIYEYGIGSYGDTSLHRLNVPEHEIKSLDDYRTRYSLYRLDKDLMEAHRVKPFITTWDDHESANNSYDKGAQNHQEATEGSWDDRSHSARKAYYEWLPVRKRGQEPLYRSFSIGGLANLIILDTRLGGRTVQMEMEDPDFNASERTILGKEQLKWFSQELESKHTWKIIGNQVPFGPLYLPDSVRGIKYMDGWDGYPYEQAKVQQLLQNVENPVFVTGDFHRSFALENNPESSPKSDNNVSVEFVVTSITSANANEYMSDEKADRQNQVYRDFNPHMKYANSKDHGYLVMHLSKDTMVVDFVYATDIKHPGGASFVEATFEVLKGQKKILPKH